MVCFMNVEKLDKNLIKTKVLLINSFAVYGTINEYTRVTNKSIRLDNIFTK